MPMLDITVSCPVHDSFRVAQVAGMFDVPLAERATERFQVELPDTTEPWQIGLIVGPSGSGKSTVARHAYGPGRVQGLGFGVQNSAYLNPEPQILNPSEWPADRAVVDCFGGLSVRQVIELFTAVGFGSAPSWIKPYRVLSGGERFRCDLARGLAVGIGKDKETRRRGDKESALPAAKDQNADFSLSPGLPLSLSSLPIVVFDEFTSVVDRDVARICSAAIAKGIRRGQIPCRFVAVTCHYDVAEWLEPDWVLDMASSQLTRRCLRLGDWPWRRPPIELEIHRCRNAAWQLFKRHHYLSDTLAPQARCYLATWNGAPVNFCATLPMLGKRGRRRFTRIVTLPDYQGIGIGMRATAAVAELHRAEGLRINVASSHPALIRHCRRSPLWRAASVKRSGSSRPGAKYRHYRPVVGRALVSFEYVGSREEGSRSERELGAMATRG